VPTVMPWHVHAQWNIYLPWQTCTTSQQTKYMHVNFVCLAAN